MAAGAAIFDVDGTLTDTDHLHVVTWWEAFRQAGHTVPMPDIHRAVGLGSGDLIERLLGPGRDRDQDSAISSAHKVLYGTYFDRLPAFEGAGELLRTLAGRDWRVVLATSASGPELAALRRAVDADEAIRDTASSAPLAAVADFQLSSMTSQPSPLSSRRAANPSVGPVAENSRSQGCQRFSCAREEAGPGRRAAGSSRNHRAMVSDAYVRASWPSSALAVASSRTVNSSPSSSRWSDPR